jgi:hypothetical protein
MVTYKFQAISKKLIWNKVNQFNQQNLEKYKNFRKLNKKRE